MSYCDWDNAPQFIYETFPKAKKQHKCCECHFPILVGETYLNLRGKWDDFSIYKQHMECREACMFARDEIRGGDCLCFGELLDWLRDSYSNSEQKLNAGTRKIRSLIAKAMWRSRRAVERKKESA